MTKLVLGAGVVQGRTGTADEESTTNRGLAEGNSGGNDASKDDEDDLPKLSWPGCFVWMTIVTLGVAMLSQWIVEAIEVCSSRTSVLFACQTLLAKLVILTSPIPGVREGMFGDGGH